MTSRPRRESARHARRSATFFIIIAIGVALANSFAAAPGFAGPRIALLIDAASNVDPIPAAFDRTLATDLAPADLVDLDELGPLLVGGPTLAQQLREQTNFAAADFRFNQNGAEGRMRFLADPNPFLAYDLSVTNTTDRTLSLFLLLDLPIDALDPNILITNQFAGQVSDRDGSSQTILTYEQHIFFGFSTDPSLATPIRLSGAAVPDQPILESIPATTIPTAQAVSSVSLQNLLTLTPGDTAHLTGLLAAGNSRTPLLNSSDIQLLLSSAIIPEPATALLLIPTLALISRRPNVR